MKTFISRHASLLPRRLAGKLTNSFALLCLASMPLAANAADVGVSVSIGQPGFYGRIDIGAAPPPVVIMPEPIIIRRPAPNVRYAPIYLRVPPGHEKNWGKHCSRYNACGRPVYFVRDEWYNDVYVPHYHEHRKPRGRDNDRPDGPHNDRPGKGHDKHDKGRGRD
jgi:hypothetical protein